MTQTAVRRSNRVHGSLIWGAAIAIHLIAFEIALLAASGEEVARASVASEQESPEEVDLKTTCMGDARLAAVARGALCLTPWSNDVEACLEQAEMMMRLDLSACRGRSEPLAPVAIVTPTEVEKVTPIDPEQ